MNIQIDNQKIPIRYCSSFKERFLGFMFQKKKITTALCFPHCRSIHTFFMFQKIDIVLADRENTIIKLAPHFSPWKILIGSKNTYYIYEFPENTTNSLKIGKTIEIKKD